MWTKPWKFKEGMVMGAGLVATGLALQACLAALNGGSGKIEWQMMAWPVNGILLGLFLALLFAMHCLRRRVYLFRYLSSYHAAVCSLLWAVILTIGMLFGALWAKEAWGHYWEWDPKETWAAITWFAYLGYIHYRKLHPNETAQGVSVHTYS